MTPKLLQPTNTRNANETSSNMQPGEMCKRNVNFTEINQN